MSKKNSQGFTLIELMITVAIVAILASIALPSYASYVKRGRLTDVFNQLSTYALRLEQNFQNQASYVSSGTTCSPAISTLSSDYFTFTCTGAASTFTVTATGKGSMVGFVFTINESGTKTTTSFDGSSYSTAKTCWMTKKGDC